VEETPADSNNPFQSPAPSAPAPAGPGVLPSRLGGILGRAFESYFQQRSQWPETGGVRLSARLCCAVHVMGPQNQRPATTVGEESAMDENPYRAPLSQGPAVGVLSGRREDVRSVALYQKGILVCILLYLCAVLGQFLVPEQLRIFIGLGVLLIGLAGTVFVFLLAIKVYGVGLGILLGVLTFIPCVGLIVLLVVNNKATNVLRQNGYTVGLLGAKL
jgi:hypothetical protein